MLPKFHPWLWWWWCAAVFLALFAGPIDVSQAQCFCRDEVVPVCGTDGVTYSNICNLMCVQQRTGARLAKFGNCQGDQDRPY